MDADESLYHASPQVKGKIAHESIDNKKASTLSNDIISLSVYSEKYGLIGKIDIYKKKEKKIIERKNRISNIYRGQIYQLWAQMFCLQEMGYEVDQLAFYEISTNKMIPISKPTEEEIKEFEMFIDEFKKFDPEDSELYVNQNKCNHCIYCNICEKSIEENVYT